MATPSRDPLHLSAEGSAECVGRGDLVEVTSLFESWRDAIKVI
jgi:hypothetical protein